MGQKSPPNFKAAKHIASGVRSKVFVSAAGIIIRKKSLWSGTYEREARALDFMQSQGGIGCAIPRLKVSIHGSHAYSEHAGIAGDTYSSSKFQALGEQQKRQFAQQLTDALVRLHDIGQDERYADWTFHPRKHGLIYRFLRWLSIRQFIGWKDFLVWGREVRQIESGGWVHNDLHGKNIIVTQTGELAGLIDFDGVMQGPFEYNLRKMDKVLRELVIDAYDRAQLKRGGQFRMINRYAADYYRVMVLAQKMRTAGRARKAQLTQELLDILGAGSA
jgi:aminoglycoside phosphotransferase (APT) family kinase protein